MKRTVYLVRGSEDGSLGIYSNPKLAYNRAISYDSYPQVSCAVVQAQLRAQGYYHFNNNNSSCEIERFTLNE